MFALVDSDGDGKITYDELKAGLRKVGSQLAEAEMKLLMDVIKYVGDEQEKRCLQMKGLNLMDKILIVQGARIAIWDVGGDHSSFDQIPIACKDVVAILFMFDFTSRGTLNNVISWYSEARKWNQEKYEKIQWEKTQSQTYIMKLREEKREKNMVLDPSVVTPIVPPATTNVGEVDPLVSYDDHRP